MCIPAEVHVAAGVAVAADHIPQHIRPAGLLHHIQTLANCPQRRIYHIADTSPSNEASCAVNQPYQLKDISSLGAGGHLVVVHEKDWALLLTSEWLTLNAACSPNSLFCVSLRRLRRKMATSSTRLASSFSTSQTARVKASAGEPRSFCKRGPGP